jgi:hypothetical protein
MKLQRILLAFVIGLGGGALGGAVFGWFVPLQDVDAELADLHPEYQAEYVVMVAQAYAADNDWDAVQTRLGRLGQPDPAGYIVQVTERFIAEGRSPDDIRNLVRLAARYGVITEPMRPYLPVSGQP